MMVPIDGLSIVPAGAGAGKTHHIQTTLARWVREKTVRPERILAVTYTEAAAGELRQRIRTALIADGDLDAALAVDRAYVSTIHGLGWRLLVEHAFAGGTSPQLRLIADEEEDLLIRRSIEQDPELAIIARDLPAYGYRDVVHADDSAEDVFRRTLLDVIKRLRALGPRGTDPALVDAVEASVRQGYGKPVGQPVALAASLKRAIDALLDAFPRQLPGGSNATAENAFSDNFLALTRARRMFATGVPDWATWQKLRNLRLSVRGKPTPDGYDELAAAVMAAADALVHHPEPLEHAVRHARMLVSGAQAAMADYAQRKRELEVIDYGDMVTSAVQLVSENPAVLGAILEEVDCVIIDEFQDTNPIQFTFLWTLARRARRALIVGDTKQAIMGFQGADPRLTEALTRTFATSPLTSNWRSDPRIMAFVNAIGPCLFGSDYIPLAAERAAGAGTALEVMQLANKRSARGAKPQYFIADRIASLLGGASETVVDRNFGHVRPLRPGDIALLCPTHKMCADYARSLRDLGLPVRVGEGGWWQSPVVQALVFALRHAVDPGDLHAALCLATLGPDALPIDAALKTLTRGEALGGPTLSAIAALSPAASALAVDGLIQAVIAATGLRGWADRLDDPAQMRADLLRFEAEAGEFVSAHRDTREAAGFHGDTAQTFLGWLENKVERKDGDQRPPPAGEQSDGIEIVTWHSAKGREWPVVVVCGLDWARDPRAPAFATRFPGFDDLDGVIEQATLDYAPAFAAPEATNRFLDALRPGATDDARRLLYVALTRARDRLILEWPLLDKPNDGPVPITAQRLLVDDCAMRLDGNSAAIGTAVFPARMTLCSPAMPAAFEDDRSSLAPASNREPRHAILARTPDAPIAILSPSNAITTHRALPLRVETHAICPGIMVSGAVLTKATDRGTAIHEAFRILLQRPDLAHRVGAHCRLDDIDVCALAIQAEALRASLAQRGYATLHVEQPVTVTLSDGTALAMIVDLIAEGPDGYVIVDHKSGAVDDPEARMATYWPQLAAYADAVKMVGRKRVNETAIFWTDTGEMTLAAMD